MNESYEIFSVDHHKFMYETFNSIEGADEILEFTLNDSSWDDVSGMVDLLNGIASRYKIGRLFVWCFARRKIGEQE